MSALVAVAACGGGGSDGPDIKETTAPTPTPTASATPAGDAAGTTRPKDDRTEAGAIAFSSFVVNRIVGVTTGSDIDDVLTLATADCAGCIDLAKDTRSSATVQKFDGPPVVRDAKVIDTSDDKTQYLVEQTLELPTGQKVDKKTGAVAETFDAPTQISLRVLCLWRDGRWVISNYSSKKIA